MNVLLLGSTGMVGRAIYTSLERNNMSVTGVARRNSDYDCDVTDDAKLKTLLYTIDHDVIINCAALVDIDHCDENPSDSWRINARLLSVLAHWSQAYSVPLLQISTDHYYDYGDNHAHAEEESVILFNEYARHKYAAEAFALTSKHSLVLRTSILGTRSVGKMSLIDWAITELPKRTKTYLFFDAWTSSVDVETFAYLACEVFFRKQHRGLINLAAGEVYSKEQLIRCLADKLSIAHNHCVSASIKKRFSNRPNCLGLDVSRAESILGMRMPLLEDVCDSLIAQSDFHTTEYEYRKAS